MKNYIDILLLYENFRKLYGNIKMHKMTKQEPSLKAIFFLRRFEKINPNLKILLSYWSQLKYLDWLLQIYTAKEMTFKLGFSLGYCRNYFIPFFWRQNLLWLSLWVSFFTSIGESFRSFCLMFYGLVKSRRNLLKTLIQFANLDPTVYILGQWPVGS